MAKLRVGDPLDKSMDMGAIIAPIQKDASRTWSIKAKRKVLQSGNGKVNYLKMQKKKVTVAIFHLRFSQMFHQHRLLPKLKFSVRCWFQ